MGKLIRLTVEASSFSARRAIFGPNLGWAGRMKLTVGWPSLGVAEGGEISVNDTKRNVEH